MSRVNGSARAFARARSIACVKLKGVPSSLDVRVWSCYDASWTSKQRSLDKAEARKMVHTLPI